MTQSPDIDCPIDDRRVSGDRTITVALAGRPNCGKSTVFNVLTGLDQHVGNWPGKTVEKREGSCRFDGKQIRLVDLPGTYSLTSSTAEEIIARDFILNERPDVVVAVLDAATLERSLYLVAELLWLPVPLVLGLNMMDVAGQHGVRVEPHVLEAALGIPVVSMVARRNQGTRELMDTALAVAAGTRRTAPRRPDIREDHKAEFQALLGMIAGRVPAPYPEPWVALKLFEGDAEMTALVRDRMPDRWEPIEEILGRHEDGVVAVAGGRYQWIGRMVRAAVVRPAAGQVTITARLDSIATHPFWGLLALLGLLAFVFRLTYAIGTPMQHWVDANLVHLGARVARAALEGSSPWVSGLLVDGVIGGVGTELTLLPILVIFFAVFGLLEDVGYMTRGAFVVDRYMHPLGLHGRSFLPLCLGFGCNVPAVFSARTIDDPPRRLLTVLLAPLVPCSARMAVVAILVPVFFPRHATLVACSLVALNLLFMALVGRVLHRVGFSGKRSAFIMELPLYHLPHAGTIARSVWLRTLAFIRSAASVIVAGTVILWVFSTLPAGEVETSYLARLGHALAPIGALVGLNWRMLTALLASFVGKENTIATIGVLFNVAETDQTLNQIVGSALTPAAALALMVVHMLFIPCVATVAAMRIELGAWRWILVEVVFLLLASFAVGAVVYHVALAAGLGG